MFCLIDSATTKLREQTRSFDNVHSKTLEFVNNCNDKISPVNMDKTLEIVCFGKSIAS